MIHQDPTLGTSSVQVLLGGVARRIGLRAEFVERRAAGAGVERIEEVIATLDYDEFGGADVSFRGALAKSSPLLARCITWSGKGDSDYNFLPKSCASPHKGEYVGAYVAPVGPFPSTTKAEEDLAGDGCGDLVARFVGFSSWSQMDNADVGYYELGFDEAQWNMGDRSVRCYAAAYTKDGEFVGSVKGIKSRTPKG